jgi:hypothetical protein
MSDFRNRINKIKVEAEELDDPVKGVMLEIIGIISDLYLEPLLTEKLPIYRFLEEKNLKSHIEYIIGMAYYLYKFMSVDPFNADDIRRMYDDARIPSPSNINDLITKNCKKGYFIERETKNGLKAWTISIEGIKFVEERKG